MAQALAIECDHRSLGSGFHPRDFDELVFGIEHNRQIEFEPARVLAGFGDGQARIDLNE